MRNAVNLIVLQIAADRHFFQYYILLLSNINYSNFPLTDSFFLKLWRTFDKKLIYVLVVINIKCLFNNTSEIIY